MDKKVYVKWSEWQIKPIPEGQFTEWKNSGAFSEGMAIVVGKVWRGLHAGEYFIFIDCDNALAIQEFCTRKGKTVTIEEIAQKFVVEQHPDDTSKAHIYFYSKIPFVKKSSDAILSSISTGADGAGAIAPTFEIKGQGMHGLAYCTPSYHKNGHRYQIIGTLIPSETLEENAARELMQHIDTICKKYGLRYLENAVNGNNNGRRALTPLQDLFRDEFVIVEGNNRHEALLRVMDSLIRRNYGVLDLDEIKQISGNWNQKHYMPPLHDREFEKQWKQAIKFIVPKIQEEEEQEQGQEQENPESQPEPEPEREPIPLTEELTRETNWQEIAGILDISIKKDRGPKLITFCAMLLAQTNNDQLTLGFQAESSAGKSYIPLEVSLYFPKNEIDEIASASPTAFYHDSANSKWDAERKLIVCNLEHKNLIFMDMQHFLLLEKLRPMISHDRKELKYKITDKSAKHGIKTKNVIIKGFPSVFFCSTNTDPDEQEMTRMILLSPETDQEKLKETLLLAALRKSNPEEYKRRMDSNAGRRWIIDRIYAVRQGSIREVIVPDDGKTVYDRFIADHPNLQSRHQRDLPRIFSFIKAHALLNCFNREKVEEEGKLDTTTIIANQKDIEAGFELYKGIEQANELGLSPYLYRIYAEIIEPMLKDAYYREDGEGLNNKDIMRKYYAIRHKPIGPRKLKDILEQLETVGLIRLDVDQNGDKRQKLVYDTALSKLSEDDLKQEQKQENKQQ